MIPGTPQQNGVAHVAERRNQALLGQVDDGTR